MSFAVERRLANAEETQRLGAEVALMLGPGDLVALDGPVGAGKTTLARAVIEALAGGPVEVPSPTFTLVQSYPGLRLPLAHFDLYRLGSPDELGELGLDDALGEGVAVVEWAARTAGDLPGDRLDIALAEDGADARVATLTGHGSWAGRLERAEALGSFIAASGWDGATRRWLKGDASSRSYERLSRSSSSAVVMNAPKGADGPPVRGGKPYSRIAHLAEDVGAFVAVCGFLRGLGLSSPEIFASDLERGFLVSEDLGDTLFGGLVVDGADLAGPYEAALEALAVIHAHPAPQQLDVGEGRSHRVPEYDVDAFLIEAELLTDWYWPAVTGGPCPEDLVTEYRNILRELHGGLDGPPVLVLRDFHSPNLLWLADRSGPARAGIIDFQDALAGHAAYDLVSLAQDARVDLPGGMEDWLVERYLELRPEQARAIDAHDFRAAYAVLGAQRAAKIVGIFTRLARRDGKHAYLPHIPRVVRYLRANLRHPRLARLARWFDRNLDLDRVLPVAGR